MDKLRAKQQIIRVLRGTRLLPLFEHLRGCWSAAKYRRDNAQFRRENPTVVLPPQRLMHDPYGAVHYGSYWRSGQQSAQALAALVNEETAVGATARILEWGCGPARILRHLSTFDAGRRYEVWGTDYNREAIEWCAAALPNVHVKPNELAPPLDFPPDFFDFVYCISVFTHLSEAMHHAWLTELLRVMKPGGRVLVTLHGDAFRARMLPEERVRYDAGELVIRGGISEGQRMFTAWHGHRFVRESFLKDLPIITHLSTRNPISGLQDLWIVRKPTP